MQWTATQREISTREYFVNSWWKTEEYQAAGISIVDLSAEEIMVAVQEFWNRCSGAWEGTPEDQARQDEFWDICTAWPDHSRYHGSRHEDARIGASWLRSKHADATSSNDLRSSQTQRP